MTSKDRWANDRLGRQEEARHLTTYLTVRYADAVKRSGPDSWVLNVNADWGRGKSFMLRNWAEDLRDEQHPVVFFDAWHNDYSSEPLLGFLAEVESQLKAVFDKHLPKGEKATRSLFATVRRAVPIVGKTALTIGAKKLVGYGIEELSEVVAKQSDASGSKPTSAAIDKALDQIADSLMEGDRKVKSLIATFRSEMAKSIVQIGKKGGVRLPIFVLIDELDRCRPDFSIELLEGIKHIFGIPGVYFVLASNTTQLAQSVKAVYGAGFDSHRYLHRFFDEQYLLAEPHYDRFSAHLFETFGLNSSKKYFVPMHAKFYEPADVSMKGWALFCESLGIGLRDQEQMAGVLKALELTWSGPAIHLFLVLALLAARMLDTEGFVAAKSTAEGLLLLDGTISQRKDTRALLKVKNAEGAHTTEVFLDSMKDLYHQTLTAKPQRAVSKLLESEVYTTSGALGRKLKWEEETANDGGLVGIQGLHRYYEQVSRAGRFIPRA